MEYSDIPGVFDLVQMAANQGVRYAVISPGSRNAPLSITLHRHPDIETYVIPDERAAAFFALGMARQLKAPVMICCTSGSAALNYAPAVAEAFYQRVPLLVVTADRPAQWIDQGDGQTIRQKEVYRNFIRGSFEMIQDAENESDRSQNRCTIEAALNACTLPVPGPVHLNVPLSEPLYNTREYNSEEFPSSSSVGPISADTDWQGFPDAIAKSDRVMILCGMLDPDAELNNAINKLAELPQVVVLTETTSNLHGTSLFGCIDRLAFSIEENDFAAFQPDVLLTIGHQIISKKIKALLRAAKPREHWHIDTDVQHPNTFQALTHSLRTTPLAAMRLLSEKLTPVESSYSTWFRSLNEVTDEAHREFMLSCPYSDMLASESLLKAIPKEIHFYQGNSASVRYVQLFTQGRPAFSSSNRGTSGIDGCTSTALGSAFISGKPTLLLTGDMAFLYDSNAFWHSHIPNNFKVVVLNNGGGGIFRIIDGAKDETELERYFEAHHTHRAEQLAVRYGLNYTAVHNNEDLKKTLPAWLDDASGPSILEVFTPRHDNDLVLKQYFRKLKAAWLETKAVKHG